jgi:hypothetical protein
MNDAPTDKQLQLALAKMLPELIWVADNRNVYWEYQPKQSSKVSRAIHDSEWLHVCWLIEQTLTRQEKRMFTNELQVICQSDPFTSVSASWQQRAIALAKIKGIEIK